MKPFAQSLRLMGNAFTITVVAANNNDAQQYIDNAVNEIRRIEKLLTTFSDESQTSLINKNAGVAPVAVSREVFELIERSIAISKITQGAFDITYGSIDKSLWNFDKAMTRLPSKDEALQRVHLINYKNIILDKDNVTVFLKEKGMRIGFGGIGKGYAAEKAKALLVKQGVQSGIINASGDLTAWGTQPDKKPWRIGISNPDKPQDIFSYIDISEKAVATS